MWRSVVVSRKSVSSSSLTRRALVPFLSNLASPPPPRVLSFHNLESLQSPSPSHFSTNVVSLKPSPILLNPRFFSNDSLSPTNDDDDVQDSSWSSETDVNEISSSISPHSDEFGHVLMVDGLASGEEDQPIEEENQVFEIDLNQLESLLSLLQSSSNITLDGSFESTLDNMGLTLRDDFIVRVLETPLIPGQNLIRFFKWYSNNPAISVSTRAFRALVRAICSGQVKEEAYALWDFVQEIGEKQEKHVLTTEILNDLISLFSKLRIGSAGFQVFTKFDEFGCVPDAQTYYYTVKALCKRKHCVYPNACSVCEKMISTGILPDSGKVGKIITYMCKDRISTEHAHSVYLFAKENNRHPPAASLGVLINSLCREDDNVCLALELLDDFSADERKYAIKPFATVVSGLCRIKDVEGAKALLFKMIDAGPLPGNAVFNEIINSLSKSGEMEEAKKMVEIMENRGLKPDVYTYSVIMSGYVRGGEMDAACKVLGDAKKKHKKLCPVTYHTLIRGYCKLEEYDKALKLLSEMKEFGVEPTSDEYTKLIQSLCLKALDWETAEKLRVEMKDNGLHLNGITEGLIRAVKAIEDEEAKREEEEVTVESKLS